ncbi:hypothetical protein L1887_54111 [Cichorium endivia]|nr:hypothetical protein L1887_54111 [Cichorium endivia]
MKRGGGKETARCYARDQLCIAPLLSKHASNQRRACLVVRQGVAVLEVDLVAGEAALDVVHPACGVGVGVGADADALELGEEVHVDVDRGPLVGVAKVGLEAAAGALDDELAAAPVGDHGVPEALVGVVGDRLARAVRLRELLERQRNDGRALVKFDAAPGGGRLALPVGLEGGGGEIKAEPDDDPEDEPEDDPEDEPEEADDEAAAPDEDAVALADAEAEAEACEWPEEPDEEPAEEPASDEADEPAEEPAEAPPPCLGLVWLEALAGPLLVLAHLSALGRVGGDGTADVLMPVAERLGLGLGGVEAKRGKHGERCDGKERGAHVVYGSKGHWREGRREEMGGTRRRTPRKGSRFCRVKMMEGGEGGGTQGRGVRRALRTRPVGQRSDRRVVSQPAEAVKHPSALGRMAARLLLAAAARLG